MSSTNTKHILEKYKEAEQEKEENIQRTVEEYLTQPEPDEEESKHYTKFAEEGTEAIKTMTGFLIRVYKRQPIAYYLNHPVILLVEIKPLYEKNEFYWLEIFSFLSSSIAHLIASLTLS